MALLTTLAGFAKGVKEAINLLGEVASILGLKNDEEIKSMLKNGVVNTAKRTFIKKGTFAEFNQALLQLSAREQDKISDVMDLLDKQDQDDFRINAVLLSGPAQEDTVKLLQKVASFPDAAEAKAWLTREHYLDDRVNPQPKASKRIKDKIKAAHAATSKGVKTSGFVPWSRRIRRKAEKFRDRQRERYRPQGGQR